MTKLAAALTMTITARTSQMGKVLTPGLLENTTRAAGRWVCFMVTEKSLLKPSSGRRMIPFIRESGRMVYLKARRPWFILMAPFTMVSDRRGNRTAMASRPTQTGRPMTESGSSEKQLVSVSKSRRIRLNLRGPGSKVNF